MHIDAFLDGVIEEKLLNLHTTMPAKVLTYDEAAKRATVQPLYLTKEIGAPAPVLLPVIENVPVVGWRVRNADGTAAMIEPIFQAGDIVYLAFCERALDEVLGGRAAYPSINRRHNLTDAVILGVLL